MTIFNWQHQPRWTLTTSFSWSYLLWYHGVYLPVNHFWDIFSPQSHLFFSKQRGGLDEVGHLVEQQLLSPTDRWSKWEKQMYNQDIARARLCQDMPLARSEAGIELRRTWAALRTDEVGLRWINCKGRLWGNQPLNKEVGSRNSPKNLRESHCAHKGEEWGLTSLSLLSPVLAKPRLENNKTQREEAFSNSHCCHDAASQNSICFFMLWFKQPYGQFWVSVKEEREALTLWEEKF